MSDELNSWSRCNDCDRNTHHAVLKEHRYESDPSDYRYTELFQIIRCMGCHNVSYRTELHEIEHGFQNHEGEFDYPVSKMNFPHHAHKSAFVRVDIPETVNDIYDETIAAYSLGALTLTGVGLRATIEAICNEQKIKGRTLETRINKLSNLGYISKNDTKRLHAIRFLGNDSAHEVVKPKKKSVSVAITLIEHLITTLYVLDHDVAGNLDGVIDNFNDFDALLKHKIEIHTGDDELPIKGIVGKDMRRIDKNYNFTNDLGISIAAEKCEYLSIGKLEKYKNSPDKIQYYKIHKEKLGT